jgi:NAD(P)-dependent dehydrogenase (short-subunit alcohol dehydrogenase family)
MEAWDEVHRVGLRSAYAAAILAAPYMIEKRSGLIANISSYGAVDYLHGVPYGTAKAALDRLTRDLGHELAEYDVTVVSLWPGTVRTELVLSLFEDDGHGGKHLVFPADPGSEQEEPTDIANTESPRFSGRAVAAVYNDEKRMQRTGGAYPVAAIAEDYGYTDLDGSRPPVFYSHEDARRVLPKQPNR